MEGYAAAMLARQVKLEWFWQIRNAALHEAVRHLRSWLIESEVLGKRIQELCSTFFPREIPEHGLTFDADLRYWVNLELPLTSEFKQTPSWCVGCEFFLSGQTDQFVVYDSILGAFYCDSCVQRREARILKFARAREFYGNEHKELTPTTTSVAPPSAIYRGSWSRWETFPVYSRSAAGALYDVRHIDVILRSVVHSFLFSLFFWSFNFGLTGHVRCVYTYFCVAKTPSSACLHLDLISLFFKDSFHELFMAYIEALYTCRVITSSSC